MTAQRDQLQALIAEIDSLLEKASPKLPWVMSNEAAQQRQMLEKTRAFLQSLQQQAPVPGGWGPVDPATGEVIPGVDVGAGGAADMASASQVLQALLQEMQYLRSQTLQPLRAEIEGLQQQRTALLQEVRQLEVERLQLQQSIQTQGLNPTQVNEIFHQLAGRLEQQMQATLEAGIRRLDAEISDTHMLAGALEPAPETPENSPRLTPSQRLAHLKQIQAQSDQLVLNLDRTLRTVFESLQQSAQSYQASLSQGLDTMHTLGQQGEMMFKALINHLAQDMSQEVPKYLSARNAALASPQLPQGRGEATVSSDIDADSGVESVDDSWDIDSLDLDMGLEDDDEITLFQLDEEITRLQLDDEDGSSSETAAEALTAIEPLQVLDQLDEAAPGPESSVEMPEDDFEDDAEETTAILPQQFNLEELDDLYDTLFGDRSVAPPREMPEAEGLSTTAEPSSIVPEPEPESEEMSVAESPAAERPMAAADDATLQTLLFETGDMAAGDTSSASPASDPSLAAESLPPEDGNTLDEVFGDAFAQDLQAEQPAIAPAMTISSLADLLPETSTSATDANSAFFDWGEEATEGMDSGSAIAEENSEEGFIPASPEEDLLATDEVANATEFGLELDQETFAQLNADLSRLENLDLSAAPETDWDLGTSPQQSEAAEAMPESSDPPPAPAPEQSLGLASSQPVEEELPTTTEESAAIGDLFGQTSSEESPYLPTLDDVPEPQASGLEDGDMVDSDEINSTDEQSEEWPSGAATDLFADVPPTPEPTAAPPEDIRDDTSQDLFSSLDDEPDIMQALMDDTQAGEDDSPAGESGLTREDLFDFSTDHPMESQGDANLGGSQEEPPLASAETDLFGDDFGDLPPDTENPASEPSTLLDLESLVGDLTLDLPSATPPPSPEATAAKEQVTADTLFGEPDSPLDEPEPDSPQLAPSLDEAGAPNTVTADSLFGEAEPDSPQTAPPSGESDAPDAVTAGSLFEDSEMGAPEAGQLDFPAPSPESPASESPNQAATDSGAESGADAGLGEFSITLGDLNLSLDDVPSGDQSIDLFASGDSPATASDEAELDDLLDRVNTFLSDRGSAPTDFPAEGDLPRFTAADLGLDDDRLDALLNAPTDEALWPESETAATISLEAIANQDDQVLAELPVEVNLGLGEPEMGGTFAAPPLVNAESETEALIFPTEPSPAPDRETTPEPAETSDLFGDSLLPETVSSEDASLDLFQESDSQGDLFQQSEAQALEPETAGTEADQTESPDRDINPNPTVDDLFDANDFMPDTVSVPAPSMDSPVEDIQIDDIPESEVSEAIAGQDFLESEPEIDLDQLEEAGGADGLFGPSDGLAEENRAPQTAASDADDFFALGRETGTKPEPAALDDDFFTMVLDVLEPELTGLEDAAIADQPQTEPEAASEPASPAPEVDWLAAEADDQPVAPPSEPAAETGDNWESLDLELELDAGSNDLFSIADEISDADENLGDSSPVSTDQADIAPLEESPSAIADPSLTTTDTDLAPIDLDAYLAEFDWGSDSTTAAEAQPPSDPQPVVDDQTEMAIDAQSPSENRQDIPDETAAAIAQRPPENRQDIPDEAASAIAEVEVPAPETVESSPEPEPLTAVPVTMTTAIQPLEPASDGEEDAPGRQWFLGLDVGTTGLSAVLLERQTGEVHPLYWIDNNTSGATADKFFRLPAIAALSAEGETAAWRVTSVGSTALTVNWNEDDPNAADASLLLRGVKPLLKLGIPYYATATGRWEPQVQWSDTTQIPLQAAQAAVEGLLATLSPQATQVPFTVGAVGLEANQVRPALNQLAGIIVSYPANWPDTYSFNLREAILRQQLARSADQIYFIEDAIAAVLSGLPNPEDRPADVAAQPLRQQTLYACNWVGGTVIISAGAALSELGVVNLPQDLHNLAYDDFALHSLAYGGDALDQDIICHLLHPLERRQVRQGNRARPASGWGWQAAIPELEDTQWSDLALEELEHPRPAEPDLELRHFLQQRLEASLLGQTVVEATRHLKLILQHQHQFELELADQRWLVRRKDLESRIVLPYIQRLNGHLNRLLSETGVSAPAVNQVICTGGTASVPAIARWLRQKFPNATIVQDTYPSNRPPSCSRVAYGLVNLVRYPQVLDLTRHQYSDNFLLMELMRTFPDAPMPLSGILHLLEQQGINTEACEAHLLALLEGSLPPGLVPSDRDGAMLSEDSLLQETVEQLLDAPLFNRQSGQIYVPNTEQCERLRQYMAEVLADKQQTLHEPLIAHLVMLLAGAGDLMLGG